jgi:GNAT superfamily N-acetyltransferase
MRPYVRKQYIWRMYFTRQATENDAVTIRDIAEITWQQVYAPILSAEQLAYMLKEIYSEEKLTDQIKNNQQTYLLLVQDEQTVAFAAFSPRGENPDIYKLHKLYCLPSTQGKGYGKVLVNEAISQILQAGKHALELNVNRYNNAKNFYEKLGFSVIYEEDVPIGPYFMNDFVMRKEF